MEHQTLVISLGGSLIVPDKIDISFLNKFKKIILKFTKLGNKIIIICGGGNICRLYQKAVKIINPKVLSTELDSLGIEVTKINAVMLQKMFAPYVEKRLLLDPTKKLYSKKRIIIGCGWKPGWSTDKDAVYTAKTYGVQTIINLSNISYIYDKDPKKYKNANSYKTISWDKLQKIVGNIWRPGEHLPFDPEAVKLAWKLRLRLVVLKGKNLKNFENFLHNKNFKGTQVS